MVLGKEAPISPSWESILERTLEILLGVSRLLAWLALPTRLCTSEPVRLSARWMGQARGRRGEVPSLYRWAV